MNTWTKLTAAALMSAALLGTGLTAKPLLPSPAGAEITAAADYVIPDVYDTVTVGDLTFRVYDTYASVKKCKENAVTVNIPATVSGVPVTGIGDSAFSRCKALTSVTIPDGVTSIGDYAFKECSGLTSVTIPDGVTSIGYGAFEDCTGLKSITLPDSVTSIDTVAFYGCSSLTDIKIPDSVTSISEFTFWECTALTGVTIPDGVTTIGESAFNNCQNLTDIKIPDSVTSISEYAFCNCRELKSITIPDGVTTIGEGAFADCRNLTDIMIPDGVTYIDEMLFSGCRELKSVTIPDSVTSIGKDAFGSCWKLKSITIPDGVTTIGEGAFCYCDLTAVMIPESVQTIGKWAFSGCENLKSITIPDSVTSIGQDAFFNCPNLTVKGEAGSYAEQYAAENSIPFVQKTFIHSADVKLSKTDFACTGSPVKIGSWITVTVNGRKLTYGTDFVTVYKNNVGTGYQTASVTVKGRGDYAGQITKKFTIKPAKPAAPVLTTGNGGIRVTWQRDANADGVLVRYSKDSTFSSGSHDAVYMTKTATDLKKYTKPGETWYVKIYSFIKLPDGTKRGSWSDAVSIKVR